MEYLIQVWAIGRAAPKKICKDKFMALKNAKRALNNAIAIEEKYEILCQNYLELEKEVMSCATDYMVEGWPSYDSVGHKRLLLNRRVANLLTTARLYVDHAIQNAKKCLPDNSPDRHLLKQLFSAEYDAKFEYRFMEALRNYVQHSGLAIHHFVLPGAWVETKEGRMREQGVRIFAGKEYLEGEDGFKKFVYKEMPERVDLMLSARSYMESLSAVHMKIRKMVDDHVSSSRSLIKKAIDEYKEANPEASVGIVVCAREGDEAPYDYLEKVSLLLDWDDVRISLVAKNSQLKNLSKSYPTGGPYSS